MEGDDAMRHCNACDQKVYQLSNMSSEQVEEFLLSRKRRGLRTCVRFYQRNDGTLLTSDCSVGKARKRKTQVLSVFGAAAVSASAVALSMGGPSNSAKVAPEPPTVTPVIEGPVMLGQPIIQEVVTPDPPQENHEYIEEPIEMLGDVMYEPSGSEGE